MNTKNQERPNILIAQHDERDLELLYDASMRYNRYDVNTASTGQEIVDKINEQDFDTVILGLKFPDLTGSTLAYLIKEFNPDIKIVFLTIYNTETLIEAVESLNCVFLNKTVEMQDIDALCEKIYKIAIENYIKKPIEKMTSYTTYPKLSIPYVLRGKGAIAYGK